MSREKRTNVHFFNMTVVDTFLEKSGKHSTTLLVNKRSGVVLKVSFRTFFTKDLLGLIQ